MNFFECHLDDTHAAIIAEFLLHDDTMSAVNLSFNQMGPEGGRALAKSLETNRSVRTLWLASNRLGEKCAIDFINAFRRNVVVTHLNLSDNGMSADSLSQIELLVQRNLRIPKAVQSLIFFLIGVRQGSNRAGMGLLGEFPKEIIKMVAIEIWATRKDPKWIDALI